MAENFANIDKIANKEKSLTTGYLRSINHSRFHIPPLIYKLCIWYRLRSAQYLWTIDPSTLLQMKNAAIEQQFSSPTFNIEGISWRLDAYPNGYDVHSSSPMLYMSNLIPSNEGSFDLFFRLVHMPSTWDRIGCCIKVQCLETMFSKVTHTGLVTHGYSAGCPMNWMLFSEIQSLDSLSFSIEIIYYVINLRDNNRVLYEREIVLSDQSLEWSVDPKIIQKLKSSVYQRGQWEIFGGSPLYALSLTSSFQSVAFGLRLCALPSPSQSHDISWTVQVIATGHEYEKVESETTRNVITLNNTGPSGILRMRESVMLSVEDLMSTDSLTVRVNIKVHDDDCIVDDQYTTNHWTELAQRQQKEKRGGNGEEYNDQMEKRLLSMQNDIHSLKSSMASMQSQTSEILKAINLLMLREDRMTLNETHCNLENNESELREWIENKVKLPQYLELLIENGFEDLESLQDITMEHLREIRIDKIGHRIKLMKAVAALKGMDE